MNKSFSFPNWLVVVSGGGARWYVRLARNGGPSCCYWARGRSGSRAAADSQLAVEANLAVLWSKKLINTPSAWQQEQQSAMSAIITPPFVDVDPLALQAWAERHSWGEKHWMKDGREVVGITGGRVGWMGLQQTPGCPLIWQF